jgi:hypothetical protein
MLYLIKPINNQKNNLKKECLQVMGVKSVVDNLKFKPRV